MTIEEKYDLLVAYIKSEAALGLWTEELEYELPDDPDVACENGYDDGETSLARRLVKMFQL